MSVVVILGAPGTGKSTVAALLHKKLKCPWFEFGWIPEFRNQNPYQEISYEEEERLSFENLVLVTKNYLRHGYEHVLLTDIRYEFAQELQQQFGGQLKLVVLYSNSDEVLCQRILTRDNGNEYRDTGAACLCNARIKKSMGQLNAVHVMSDTLSAEEVADKVMKELNLAEKQIAGDMELPQNF